MKILYVIPARGGSKGIPGKNLREIGGKPLVIHTLGQARSLAADQDICLTTDDTEILKAAALTGYEAPFIRPAHLASDTSGMEAVIIHTLNHYARNNVQFDTVVLLQPTSPFRQTSDIVNAVKLFTPEVDMVVSVTLTDANPYYVLFEEGKDGFLQKSKDGNFKSRQDCPNVWQLNGAVYVMNVKSLRDKGIQCFTRILKTEMDAIHSLDLDTELDWQLALLINEQYRFLPHSI